MTSKVEAVPIAHSTTLTSMRVPRRVPWASKAELAELYDLLFAPGANDASRQAALSRVSFVGCNLN